MLYSIFWQGGLLNNLIDPTKEAKQNKTLVRMAAVAHNTTVGDPVLILIENNRTDSENCERKFD